MPSIQAAATLAHHVTRSDDALFQDIAGEAVLLDLASERYFGLDPVGTRIWVLLGEHDAAPLQVVRDALCAEYDADSDRITQDLLVLVDQLADAGLVTLA